FFIILTQTRKSIAILFIFATIILLFSNIPRKNKIRIVSFGLLLLLVFIFITITTSYGQGFLQRFLDYFSFQESAIDSSKFYRNQFIEFGWKFFTTSPFIGYG